MLSRNAAVFGFLVLLLAPVALALRLDAVLDSVVLVRSHFTLRGPGGEQKEYVWQGSGWIASCQRVPGGYRIVLRTAAHVVDPPRTPEAFGLDGSWTWQGVRYRIRTRDGTTWELPAGALTRGSGDSASLEFVSAQPRPALPAGDPRPVRPGDRLWTVACPQGMRFLAADGIFASTLGEAGVDLPARWRDDWWLSTLPASPGSSGAPVLDDQGRVVAHIVGRLDWDQGALSILQPREVEP